LTDAAAPRTPSGPSAGPGRRRRPAPLRPGRRDAHSALENDGWTTVVQRNASGPHRRAPPWARW